MKVALAQVNPLVGDVEGNTQRILGQLADARAAGADVALFPEQAILGYPAKDLLLRRGLIEQNGRALQHIAGHCHGIAAVVGYAEPNPSDRGRPLYNAAALLADGAVVARWHKQLLPTYDVFDEARYFEPAAMQPVVAWNGRRVGVVICEDLLSEKLFGRDLYTSDPVADAAANGAEILLTLSASPYAYGKQTWRLQHICDHARRNRLPIAYTNQIGGNDEVLFDGGSAVVDARGEVIAEAAAFAEDLLVVDVDSHAGTRRARPEGAAELRAALVMGLRDYVHKCGFQQVVVGLSGGIDSAVVACLAVEALGPENVRGVAMPSRYSSEHSVADARTLAQNLGIAFSVAPIEEMHAAFEQALEPMFEGRARDATEENIQARVRGVVLMALSNKFGAMLLTTGNKSELAVGYCTLYGDMAGGLAVLSDVPKTMVYALARNLNEHAGRPVVPENILEKPPSAELRPNQTDQQTLPPYELLDAILDRHEVRLQSVREIVEAGFDQATVRRVVAMIQRSEYKRQQAAPGLKVTTRAFGFGRRMPIAARPTF